MEEQIIIDYTQNKLGIYQLCAKYKLGKIKIKTILENGNIPLNKKGRQIIPKQDIIVDLTHKLLECKKCGKRFADTENKSGAITEHIKLCFPDVIIPHKDKRNKIKKYQGKIWHLDYYNIINKPVISLLTCPDCNWSSSDTNNTTGALTKHVKECHGSIKDFYNKHPKYRKYFNPYTLKLNRISHLEINENHVICQICGDKMKSITNTHLAKHNLTLNEYKEKYLGYKSISATSVDKLRELYDVGLRYYEKNFQSNAEIEIAKYITSLGVDVSCTTKKELKGIEMDIYVPSMKIAFEYNGLYYHCERMGKDKWYHLNKQNLAKENNITLYHIFEDEWLSNKDLILKKITHILGKNTQPKIYGRQCNIRPIGKEMANIFLDANHIQRSAPQSTINYGAFYESKLIGVMCFLNMKNYWALTRSATDVNFRAIGLPNKLFTQFKKDYPNVKVMSFADRRWTPNENKNVYTSLGFTFDKIIEPMYHYLHFTLHRNKRIHRFTMRKSILIRKFPDLLNAQMTENEMIKLLGYDKIWDCGLFRYVFNT